MGFFNLMIDIAYYELDQHIFLIMFLHRSYCSNLVCSSRNLAKLNILFTGCIASCHIMADVVILSVTLWLMWLFFLLDGKTQLTKKLPALLNFSVVVY